MAAEALNDAPTTYLATYAIPHPTVAGVVSSALSRARHLAAIPRSPSVRGSITDVDSRENKLALLPLHRRRSSPLVRSAVRSIVESGSPTHPPINRDATPARGDRRRSDRTRGCLDRRCAAMPRRASQGADMTNWKDWLVPPVPFPALLGDGIFVYAWPRP
jgi:hypothetical protein